MHPGDEVEAGESEGGGADGEDGEDRARARGADVPPLVKDGLRKPATGDEEQRREAARAQAEEEAKAAEAKEVERAMSRVGGAAHARLALAEGKEIDKEEEKAKALAAKRLSVVEKQTIEDIRRAFSLFDVDKWIPRRGRNAGDLDAAGRAAAHYVGGRGAKAHITI